jgi:exonuclease III
VKRGHGGICLFYKNHIKNGLKIVEKNSQGIIWVKLCKYFFDLQDDIFVCFLYIPPSNSVYFNLVDTDYFELLEYNIRKYSDNGKVAVIGDLNARCGSRSDILEPSTIFDRFIHVIEQDDNENYINILPVRKSMDTITNSSGMKLIDILLSTDLKIVNGRCKSDEVGNFTYISNNGNSLIDYAILSQDLFPIIDNFYVHDLFTFSPHRPIELDLKLNYFVSIENNDQHVTEKLVWNDENVDLLKFNVSQQIPNMDEVVRSIIDNNISVDEGVNKISDIAKLLKYLDQKRYLNPLILLISVNIKVSGMTKTEKMQDAI